MSRSSSRPSDLAIACLALAALNVLLFAAYRLLFVAWFTQDRAGAELPAVLLRGLRLDAAVLGLEFLLVGICSLLTRYARGPVVVGGLWAATALNLLVAGINLLFFRERDQHLWETLFAYLARPHDIRMALVPVLYEHPTLIGLLLLVIAALAALAVRHALALRGHRHDLWRSPVTIGLALAVLLVLALPMARWVIVKRVGRRSNTEIAWIASRHEMQFDQYVLNQAVVNPLWDLVHEYLPVALAGGRPPYRLDASAALQLTQRLLGVPEGDRPYPLLRMARGQGGLGIRNVVVVQVEGLGTTLLEHDTAAGPVMPFVRSLARNGLYFPSVYQSFPATDGGVFATLTSFHWTHALGGRGVRGERLAESVVGGYSGSLPRLLAGPPYRHYGFSGFRHRSEDFTSFTRNQGYRTRGFEALLAQLGPRAERDSGPLGIHDGPLLQAAATALVSRRGLFTAHVMTTTSHAPWQVPEGAPAPLGQGPVGTFRYVDDSIRAFVERLQAERPDFENTLLVVTGDHTSITFGDHFLERIRVPLVLAGLPVSRARGRWPQRHDGAASQVDVLPTILSLLDGDRLYSGMGWSLLDGRPATAGIISGETTDSFYFRDGFALRYHLRKGTAELLAVTVHDVGPTDLSAQYPQVAARLTREFLALYEAADRLMRENRMFPRDRHLESAPRP